MKMISRIGALTVISGLALFALGAQARGNAEHGKALTEKFGCTSCHGADFSTPADPAYPRLAGQHYDYLVQALHEYQHSGNRLMGRQNPIMQGFATQLSDQDVNDVATYLSGLQGVLVMRR